MLVQSRMENLWSNMFGSHLGFFGTREGESGRWSQHRWKKGGSWQVEWARPIIRPKIGERRQAFREPEVLGFWGSEKLRPAGGGAVS